MKKLPRLRIFRRSGNRFAAENAINQTNPDQDPIQFEQVMVWSTRERD